MTLGIRVDTVAEYQEDTQKNLGSIQPMDAEGKVTILSEDENTEVETASTGSLPEDVDSVESTFKVESFSAFTITWGVNTAAGVIVHYVDENGKPVLNIPKSEMTFREDLIGKTTDINEYQGGVSGYEFVNAKLFPAGSEFDANGGTLVSAVKSDAEDEKNVVFYDSNAEEIKKETSTANSSGRRMARAASTKETNKQELYLVYRPQVVPVGGEEKPLQLTDPDTSKILTSNGDGTYNLTLSVTGKSVASSGKTKANVIIVFDSSKSMDDEEFLYTPTTGNPEDQYGFDNNGESVSIWEYRGNYYYDYWNGWYWETRRYTGTRYTRTSQGTRLEAAKQAVNSLAQTLLENNTTENKDAIDITLIDFATKVKSTDKYTTYNDFEGKVDSITANGGTNWEAALKAANEYDFEDSDPVYVIFVSDGNPTFRTSGNGYNDWNYQYQVYGNGTSDPDDRNLKAAQEEAKSIVGSNKHLYMVGAFGDATNMRNLNSQGTYYNATDQAALNKAFSDIIKDIKKDLKYISVSITDGITGLTSTRTITGSAAKFKYDVSGTGLSKEECEAELEKIGETAYYDATLKSVVWNLGDDYKLIPGATYSVSFKVWPKQEAYDVIADLNNGITTWEDVEKDYPNQFKREGEDPNYTYSLLTNTNASVSYKAIETTNGTEGTSSAEKTGSIQEKPSMPLVSTKMTIQKIWQDSSDSDPKNRPESIVLNVIKDGKTEPSYKTIELKGSNDSDIWTKTIYIAPGLKVNGTILEDGHDYTLTESTANAERYEFETETVHPMLVDSNVNITYGGTTEDSIITATNKRRGDIEIRKSVVDLSGADISKDSIVKDIPFTFTLKTLSLQNKPINVSAQLYDISYDATGAEVETPNGKQFTVEPGSTFDITTSQKVKLLNVPIGTTYKIVESEKSGYALDTEKTTSGTTVADTNYVAQFTNKMTSMDVTFLKASKTDPSQHLYGVKLQITRTVNGTEQQPVVITDKTDINGYFIITKPMKEKGMTLPLTDGEYTVKEVQAPDGYQLLADSFHFTIQGGTVQFEPQEDVEFTPNGNIFTVLNTPGIELPETGGMGTLMTTMSGMALMLIALGYLILAKRREEGGLN